MVKGNKGLSTVLRISATERCHCEITVGGTETGTDNSEKHHEIDTENSVACIYSVFGEYDCVPEITEMENESYLVMTEVPCRDSLRGLLDSLDSVAESVDLIKLTSEGDDENINRYGLTQKQQEALSIATEYGYYDSPKETDLEEIADAIGVSKSAASQRLKAAEAKLAKRYSN